MKKGASLPINTVVVLMVAVVVLLAVIGFFLGATNPSKDSLVSESTLRAECNKYVAAGCPDSFTLSNEAWDAVKERSNEDADWDDVKRICGCS